MQRADQTQADQVQRMFGPTASLRESLGTVARPGRQEIRVGERLVGVGVTFHQALEMAQRLASASCCQTRE